MLTVNKKKLEETHHIEYTKIQLYNEKTGRTRLTPNCYALKINWQYRKHNYAIHLCSTLNKSKIFAMELNQDIDIISTIDESDIEYLEDNEFRFLNIQDLSIILNRCDEKNISLHIKIKSLDISFIGDFKIE